MSAIIFGIGCSSSAQSAQPQQPVASGPPGAQPYPQQQSYPQQQPQPYPQQQQPYPQQQQPYPQQYPPPQYPPPQYPPPQYPPAPPVAKKESPHHLLCFAGRPDCASTFLLEFGYRINDPHAVFTGDIGLLIHAGYDAFGATIGFVSVSDGKEDYATPLYAGRYRRYLGRLGVAADVSVGVGRGGYAGEIALGWADVLAITAGANSFELEDGHRDMIFTTGIRIGSVGIGGLLYATVLAFSGARWR